MNVAPPSGGLIGYSNYALADSCRQLAGVSVSIDVTQEIIAVPTGSPPANEGVAFQLNCYSPAGYSVGWQQYIFVVWWKTQDLRWWVNNWTTTGDAVINAGTQLAVLPTNVAAQYSTIPAGYRLGISLGNDARGNVTQATFTVENPDGVSVAHEVVDLLSLVASGDLAPIVAVDFVIVGYANGQYTLISDGAGEIEYTATNSLTPSNTFPVCAETPWNTAESSNVTYGELDAAPSSRITQSFGHTRVVAPAKPGRPVIGLGTAAQIVRVAPAWGGLPASGSRSPVGSVAS